jgi:hypothetical protein
MRHVMLVGSLALFAAGAVAIACNGESPVTVDADAGGDGGSTDQDGGGTTSNGDTDSGSNNNNNNGGMDAGPLGNAGTGAITGLPCDVQATIENRCIACHDGKMTGVPALLNYNDLMQKAANDPSKTLAQEGLIRMQAKGTQTMPPPPAIGPDATEIASWQAWVTAGTPENTMSCTDPPPDGGTTTKPDGGDAGTTILDGGADGGSCTSMKFWSGGNTPSPDMNPGMACMACHQVKGGPNLSFGGTIYKTAHEPDLCYGDGPPPTITVTVTDRTGRAVSVFATDDGNFQIPVQNPALRAPFRAQLSDGKNTRKMNGSVTSGDCNSCHTVAGANNAPGRIMAP